MSPPSRGEVPEDSSHSMILGEMRGQLREVVHSLANLSGKFDGLSREVIGLGALAKDVIELKTSYIADRNAMQVHIEDLKREVDDLKSERDKRVGATNLVNWAVKNWPGVLGFFALIALILRTQGKL